MTIRRYQSGDFDRVMALMEDEGEEWACYWRGDAREKYRRMLDASVTFLCFKGDALCGFARNLLDGDLYVYVCDLLVGKAFRGQGIGRALMGQCYVEYPESEVFVMSDVDAYYEKQGYVREGSVFWVSRPE